MNRLVLGCGSVGLSLAERLSDRRSPPLVLVEDERRAEALREDGTNSRYVDITDSAAIRTVAGDADSIVVAPDDSARTLAVTRAARQGYPEAFVLGCLTPGIPETDRAAIEEHADRTVDTVASTAEPILDRAGEDGIRTRRLQRTLKSIDGTLAVVAHDNPDPDAIASAVGLQRLAETVGTDAEACYYGNINHQENRALVNLLEYDLRNLEPDDDLEEFAGFALVDHSRPGINDGLPETTAIDIVVDHHPPRAPVEARFVDLRSDIGATSTLISGYLHALGIEPGEPLATGLLYGIQTDTDDFSREVSELDFEAAAELVRWADSAALQRIESPSITAETLEIVGRAISNRRRENEVASSCVGAIADRDALAQGAEKLLEMEGVSTTLVFGYTDETVFVSARSRGTDLDLGEVLRDAYAQIGSAGGHADMAGAQIPVGILLDDPGETDHGEIIEEVITERFFDALGIEPDRAAAMVYTNFLGTDEYGE